MKNPILSSLLIASTLAAALVSANASATSVYITEWMYNGDEFIEFTNLGTTAVDFTGWSFDDDSRTAGSVDLSGFGIVNAGESVILSEASASAFIASWNLTGVDVIGGNSNNLGKNDEINLYDASGTLVDRITYTQAVINTASSSAEPLSLYSLGANNASLWTLSTVGDAAGSYASTAGLIASPGTTAFTTSPVPVPAAIWLLLSGITGLARLTRRK